MTINATTVTNKVIRIESPTGDVFDVDSVVYVESTGRATFSFTHTFSRSDNGTWKVKTSPNDKVLDGDGNAVLGNQLLGTFTVNIPSTGDTTPPTATLVSITPDVITSAGNLTLSILVSYSDA